MKKKPFVTIIGNMGSGKTTLAELLVKHQNYFHPQENFKDNAFLPLFFDDMSRWAFHSQTFYLKEKAKQLIKLNKIIGGKPVVLEPDILGDVEVYARAQHIYKNMSKHEYHLYRELFKMFYPNLPKADLTIYVKASVPVILERIKKRRRDFEKEIPRSYLELLNTLNDKLAEKMNAMVIETDKINIVQNTDDIKNILASIKKSFLYD